MAGVAANVTAALGPTLRGLRSGDLLATVVKAVAAEVETRVADSFRTSTSPDGQPWDPLKWRSGRPLLDTGRLRMSYQTRIQGASVFVGSNLIQARLHEFGGTIAPVRAKALRVPKGRGKKNGFVFLQKAVIPPRPVLPHRGLGRWQTFIDKAIQRAIARSLRRR